MMTRTRSSIGATCAAVVVLASSTAPLRAQSRGVDVSARLGIGAPSDDYQSNCGTMSLAYSVSVQGRRRVFPQLSLDHFDGDGGGDILCLAVAPTTGTAVGGLRLNGATRVGLGVGGRLGNRYVGIEAAVQGGVITGHRGYAGNVRDNERRVLPQSGGQGSLVLFRYVVLSAAVNWTRLSLDVISNDGSPVTTRTKWSPLTTGQLGVRLPIGG